MIIAPVEGTETVTLLAMVDTGSKNEDRNNRGISHFIEHMMFKGTEKRPSTMVISSELDVLGGVYNAFTSKEYTGYWMKINHKQLNKAADVLSDMMFNSKFEQEEIDRERGVILEELNMYLDNPMYHIEDIFENLLYGDQPAGWDVIGIKETLNKMQRKDFINYINSQYGTNNMVLCLAGKIEKDVEKKILKYFSGKNNTKPVLRPKTKEKQIKPAHNFYYKKTDQAHLSLGVRTFPNNHKDENILKMIAVILGGSMSSRLFMNLRERNGLAYYVRTSPEFYSDSGYLTTNAGVPVDKLDKALKIIIREYNRMRTELISEEELKRAKDMVEGRVVIQFEASDNLANWYGRQVIMKEKITTPKDYLTAIKKITSADIKRVANKIFANDRLNLAVIGPYKDGKKFEKTLTF